MFDKLLAEESRYEELSRLLSTVEVQSDSNEIRKHSKALAELEPLVEKFRQYKTIVQELTQAEDLANGADADMRDLAKEELKSLTAKRDAIVGGLKEVIATIEGRGVYSKLKYESGLHRVQRVPATEASGRIHTSTATVAV